MIILLLPGCALFGKQHPPLEFISLSSDAEGSQFIRPITIQWNVVGTGGTGELKYEFWTRKGSVEIVEQVGSSATWDWTPKKPGRFRVKAIIEDSAGSRVDSGWSSEYVILPPLQREALIAVLPIENLTGRGAPLRQIEASLRLRLEESGFRIVEDRVLLKFMKKHRIRYTGGLKYDTSLAMKEEIGVQAFLITSLESYQVAEPPKIALISRLVLTGAHPEIVWMDSVGMSGDDSPGFLDLGRITEIEPLLEKAILDLRDSLARSIPQLNSGLEEGSNAASELTDDQADALFVEARDGAKRKYLPHMFFRSPALDPSRRYSVAVIPFLNLSQRENAGQIMTLHFVDELFHSDVFSVVEPGLVREQLLKYRIIMEAGPSFAASDLIGSKSSLGVDLILSGTVFDYQDPFGVPRVDFSVDIFEEKSREVIWVSRSYNNGEEGVFFFDAGRVHIAHDLASQMAEKTVELMTR